MGSGCMPLMTTGYVMPPSALRPEGPCGLELSGCLLGRVPARPAASWRGLRAPIGGDSRRSINSTDDGSVTPSAVISL